MVKEWFDSEASEEITFMFLSCHVRVFRVNPQSIEYGFTLP